jgi:phage terminase large subunit GpA-like protein
LNTSRTSRGYLVARIWLATLIRAIIRPRPRTRLWKWLDAHVKIPESSGGPNPGRLRTGRFPIFRGLYDIAQQRHVHFLTLCSSARAGKTLFSICLVLYWIVERFGAVVWLDPTRNSARKLVRDEIDAFLLECEPVYQLAIAPPGKPGSKTLWTTLEKAFRGKRLRIVGSGAEADMHGFNAELAIKNELDACRASTTDDAASSDKIDARTKLFASSRLIVDNSTPQKGEFGPTWQKFLRGSQRHCYLPCRHCTADRERELAKNRKLEGIENWQPPDDESVGPGRSALSYDPRLAGWQRFTFFSEKVAVPFDAELNPLVDEHGTLLPRDKWREETTGRANFERFAITERRPRLDDPTQMEEVRVGWNMKRVRRGTTYQCAHCQRDIDQTADHAWMLARYRWMAHNPDAEAVSADEENADTDLAAGAEEHESAHIWSWYSPFEMWGVIAAEFLEAKGDLGRLIKFWVYTLGRPFIHQGAAVKDDDISRVIGRCPMRYVKGQMPFEAEELAMTIDRQGTELWYVIRAYGILWDVPGWPTWSALVDWGEIASDTQIAEKAGLAPDPQGRWRKFTFTRADGTVREYTVTRGLYDCGFEQQTVWDYCVTQAHWLSPSKGGGPEKTGGNPIRTNAVMDDQLDLVWFWSDHFAADLYFGCILYGKSYDTDIYWWLPTNTDATYRAHLTDERRVEEDGKRVWKRRVKNDLGDCEKNQRVLSGVIEEILDEVRAERRAAEEAVAKKG